MGSPYIENSKHPEMTRLVESHFSGGNNGTKPGADPALKMPPGGSAAWNPTTLGSVAGKEGLQYMNQSVAKPSIWNAPGQSLPIESGVNYMPRGQAGHSIKDDPFTLADGLPGDTTPSWARQR